MEWKRVTRNVERPFVAVTVAGTLGLLMVIAMPVASAGHWCQDIQLTPNPTSGFAGDKIPLTVVARNTGTQTVDAEVRLQFSWEAEDLSWGTVSLGPGARDTNTFTKVLTGQPGDHWLYLEITGTATQDDATEPEATCPAVSRFFRVELAPEPPTPVITANRTFGQAPLAVNFTATVAGGFAPVAVSWSFGDGANATGATTEHIFAEAGQFMVQVTASDDRQRLGTDRLTINVAEADDDALWTPGGRGELALSALLGAALMAGGAVLGWALGRRNRDHPARNSK